MLGAFNLGPAEKVMQAAHSTCRCSLEEGPQLDVWISYHLSRMFKTLGDGVFKFRSPIPRTGCCTLCPSANNWSHIWPSAPNFVESKTILRGWNSRFTSSGSFHMPLLCEISQTQVPARNFPAHLKKGPMSEVLSLRWEKSSRQLNVRPQSSLLSLTIKQDAAILHEDCTTGTKGLE